MIKSIILRVDLSDDYINKDIIIHEGDVNGTELVLAVYDNNSEFDLTDCSAEYDATIAGRLAEEAAEATITDTNKIKVPVTANMTAINGPLLIDVKIKRGADILTVYTVAADVKRAVINGATIIDISGTTIMQRLEHAVPDSRRIAETPLTGDISSKTLRARLFNYWTNAPLEPVDNDDSTNKIYIGAGKAYISNGAVSVADINMVQYNIVGSDIVYSSSTPPESEEFTFPAGTSFNRTPSYDVGDIHAYDPNADTKRKTYWYDVRYKDLTDSTLYLCLKVEITKVSDNKVRFDYTWREINFDSYSKAEIDDMIGDVESLLAEV